MRLVDHIAAQSASVPYPHELIVADRAAGWRQVRSAGRSWMFDALDATSYYMGGKDFLVLSRRDDVAEALCNRDLTTIAGLRSGGQFLATTDVAKRILRRVVTSNTATWVEKFTPVAARRIDAFARGSHGCDAMQLAWPLGAELYATLCGVDPRQFFPASPQRAPLRPGSLDITGLTGRAKASPGNDLFSGILAEAPDISDAEVGLLVNAIWHGVRVGIGQGFSYALLELARNPALRTRLRNNPADIARLVDEIARLESVAPAVPRYVMRSTVVNGLPISAGTYVLIALAAANREGDADQVDLDSATRNHFGFCGGRWLCPGFHLARESLRVLVAEWLRTTPDFELEPGYEPYCRGRDNLDSFGPLSLRELPLQWVG